MLYKPRSESNELLIYRSLQARMDLSEKEKQYYHGLEKGYEGEVKFDQLTEQLQNECLILNDLLLKANTNTFQIDSLIITSDTIHLFEVKNMDGDYYYESDRLYTKNKSEVNNPLNQLHRCESLLRQLIQSLGFHASIKAYVVFINPEFTLYQTPLHKPFIFPTQIKRFLHRLDENSSKCKGQQRRLAEKLVSLHIEDSPYSQLPAYDFSQLKKGIICGKCRSFSVTVNHLDCLCQDCGHKEKAAQAIMRSVAEYKLLFPNEKLTTNAIYDWCRVISSKKRISRILGQHFKIVGTRRWSYYV